MVMSVPGAGSSTSREVPLLGALVVLLALLAYSGLSPFDLATWSMEVAPVFIAVPVLLATYRRFPLTNLLYACIFVHAVVLMIGGLHLCAGAQDVGLCGDLYGAGHQRDLRVHRVGRSPGDGAGLDRS
jgi:hypothetical protein